MRTLKLMADYQCFPLWEASPGEIGNLDPNLLPISSELRRRLLSWADVHDSTLNLEDPATSGFEDAAAVDIFREQGTELARLLQMELGKNFEVFLSANVSVREPGS